MTNLPFSQACENNKVPILNALKRVFAEVNSVLEIGSGTGQHAAFFADQLKHLHWQPSDQEEYLAGIELWVREAKLENLSLPLPLDVRRAMWPQQHFGGVFSANTAHIMSWDTVLAMLAGVSKVLAQGGKFCLYGPFNFQGQFTSESNALFHEHLKSRDPAMGIRDFEAVVEAADNASLAFCHDHEMPANNRLLEFTRE